MHRLPGHDHSGVQARGGFRELHPAHRHRVPARHKLPVGIDHTYDDARQPLYDPHAGAAGFDPAGVPPYARARQAHQSPLPRPDKRTAADAPLL